MKRKTRRSIASTERMVDYDRNSYMQDQIVRSRAAVLRGAVERIGTVVPEFTVMDYGCGPGHRALNAVAPVIDAYRCIDPQGAMVVRHGDQARNDWNALSALLFGNGGYQGDRSGDSNGNRGRLLLHATGGARFDRARHLLYRKSLVEPGPRV